MNLNIHVPIIKGWKRMVDEHIKPCSCGGEAELMTSLSDFWVVCKQCAKQTRRYGWYESHDAPVVGRRKAIKDWNRLYAG